MVTQRFLVIFLLMNTVLWIKVLGQDKNDTNSTIGPRVVGGVIVNVEDVGGFIVVLRYKNSYVCGGTLIHDRFVITAAHCFGGKPDAHQWTVDGGVSKLQEWGIRRTVKAFRIPPAYSYETFEMDVAVVLLRDPMPQSRKIRTPDLCRQPLGSGARVTLIGFGSVKQGSTQISHYLKKAELHVLDHEHCAKVYRYAYFITKHMLCAGVLGQRDACAHDSGSPLLYGNQVCGIVSFGDKCASKVHPGIYVDVYNVKPFITRSVSEMSWLG